MERRDEVSRQDVINEAIHCAVTYDTDGEGKRYSEPTKVVDMATTGEILEGYTHMIFVAFGKTGYVVSRNLEGQYKVEMHAVGFIPSC